MSKQKKESLFQKISVTLEGLADIMFDRFIDHSKEKRPAEQRLYLTDENKVVLPSSNLDDGFLFGQDPPGCAKAFEGKGSKEYLMIGPGHVFVKPPVIPFVKSGKEVVFDGFKKGGDFWICQTPGRTKLGGRSIKQEAKDRPVLKLPWSISFQIDLVKNDRIDDTKLYNWFVRGGLLIGLGTFRPKFGRFEVVEWK